MQLQAPNQKQRVVCTLKPDSRIQKTANAASPLFLALSSEGGDDGDSETEYVYETLDKVNGWTSVDVSAMDAVECTGESAQFVSHLAGSQRKRLHLDLFDEKTSTEINRLYDILPLRKQIEALELWVSRVIHFDPSRCKFGPTTRVRFSRQRSSMTSTTTNF